MTPDRSSIDEEGRSQLLARIDTLIRELGRVEGPLDHTRDAFDAMRRDLVVGHLKHEITRQRTALLQLERDVRSQNVPLIDAWQRNRAIAGRSGLVLAESLAFVEGATSREQRLDDGLCTTADALVDELCRRCGLNWNGFTMLAGHEFIGELAEVIRLRFGEVSVWNLPIAAHELGHHAASAITASDGGTTRHPVEALLERERNRGAQYWDFGHELFADVFATWTLGPAYAFTCLTARFDPLGAHRNGRRHPSAGRRAHVILATLARLDDDEHASSGLERVRLDLDTAWRHALAGAGQPEDLVAGLAPGEPLGRSELDAWVKETTDLLDTHLLDGAPFSLDDWLSAQQAAAAWISAHEQRRELDAAQASAAGTIAVALNAGWFAAAKHGAPPFSVALKARCAQLAAAPATVGDAHA